MKKNFVKAFTVAAFATLISTAPAMAGQWKTGAGNNASRWWYANDDGSYAANGWHQINNVWYYFDNSGWMLANTTTPDGYFVNADGAWVQNNNTQTTNSGNDDSDRYVVRDDEVCKDDFYLESNFDKSADFSKYERELFNLINEDRASRGLNTIKWDDTIYQACKSLAQEEADDSIINDITTRPDGAPWYTIFNDFNSEYAKDAMYKYSISGISGNMYVAPEFVFKQMMLYSNSKEVLINENAVKGAAAFYDYEWVIILSNDYDSSSSHSSSTKSTKSSSSTKSTKSSKSSKSSSSSLDDMSDEDFQSYAQEQSGDSDEFVARNNVRYLRPGTAEYDAFNSLINYDD